MLTGELRSQINAIWDSFWSGGISNPLEVMEQITYLLFIRRLDDAHSLEESKASILKRPMETRHFPEGNDPKGRPYADLRWSRFKHFAPADMHAVVGEHVFPFLRGMGASGSTHSHHMKDARFTIPTASLLARVVDMLDQVPMDDRDTKGDLYEYMLGKIASAGQNGQFRTPRHLIQLMVEMTAPTPQDVICDPASGTCGFLVAAGEYLRQHHAGLFNDADARRHFHSGMFHGYDFDHTMLRIGSMNMALHGVENPDISYKDSLAQDHSADEERYSLILANPPFAGSLDYENTAKDLLALVKTNSGGTDHVWFYDMRADGYSLDDKRQPLLSEDKIGLQRLSGVPLQLSDADHAKNNLPDVLARWARRNEAGEGGERQRPRTAQSFCVPKADISAQGHDLSINRYKEVVHAAA